MNQVAKLLLMIFLFWASHTTCIAQAKDTLFFKKGQILVGYLKGLSLGKIDFDDDDLDVVTIKSNKIRTIRASSHIFKVTTIDHNIYYTLLIPANDGKVKMNERNGISEIAIEEIKNIFPLLGKTQALWQGDISSGYSYTRSSGIGRFNADANVSYSTKRIESLLKGSVIITRTDSTYEVENGNLTWYNSYLFNATWQCMIILSYQHNQELGLSRRYQEGLAGGLSLISTEHIRMKTLAGLALSNEKSVEGDAKPVQFGAPIVFLFDIFSFKKPDMSVKITQNLYFGLSEKGRFRQDGQLNINIKVIKDFYFNLQLYDNYDNRPPSEGSTKIDYGIVFGLKYKFSQ
jgi:hypothetical protein